MEVFYNGEKMKDNSILKVSDTQNEPIIKLNFNPSDLYTLILFDPDAVGGTHIHWAKINITNNDINKGNIIIPYKGPAPPPKSGKHRYNFVLFRQDSKIFAEPINERVIEIDKLKNILKIDNPIFKIKFISENESGGRKRRKTKRRKNKKVKRTRRR